MISKEILDQKKDNRPIVGGTDFSATAREAVDIAAEMARRLNVKLLLLHVEEFRGLAAADPVLFEALASKNREELHREAARLRKTGTLIEEKLLSGSVFNEIVDTAAESNARLIIVGAVGHGVARRLLVGSVAERVAETSAVPTLVVRPGSRLGSWIRGEHPLKILAGYDFSAASDAALRWLNGMQEIGPCEINVVHSDWPPEVAHRIGYHGPLPLTENPEQIQSLLERDLAERVAMALPPEKVTVTVEPGWGRPEGNLFELASRQRVDLVVVGTHQRHGLGRLRFGSVSRTVLHHAQATVAVIPPDPAVPATRLAKLARVLVATDFSDLGNSAVPYGAAVVQEGGTLKLIHVIHPEAAQASTGAPGSKPRPRKENPKLVAQLHALVPKEARGRFELESNVIESSDVAEAIAQEAERFRADAICLGSHGRSGVAKTLLGSVAQGVMTKSRRPVLVVRVDEK
jgi:nucleotide-binding universal stress UspA family protein